MQLPESDPKYQVCSSIPADYTTGVWGRTYPSSKGRLKLLMQNIPLPRKIETQRLDITLGSQSHRC